MNHHLVVDLELDARVHLIEEIRKLGYSYEGEDTLLAIATNFQMLLQRHIAGKPRAVELATGLAVPAHLEVGFRLFFEAVNEGRDLRPYQSRTMKDEDYRDLMLIDWGIQHFHLGTTLEPDGFVNRCDPLLFVLVTEARIYCIGFWKHGAWTDTEIVGVIHDNWPDLIRNWRINGISGLAHTPSSEDIKDLRRVQVNSAFEPRPGVFYFPPGGGQMLSGHSMTATLKAMALQRVLDQLARGARERAARLDEGVAKLVLTGYFTIDGVEVRDQSGRLVASATI